MSTTQKTSSLVFLVIAAISLSDTVNATEFTGTVTNQQGEAIQYVAVDVLGPRKIFTRTDSNGRFVVDLVNGRYTIRLRYKKKTIDYSIRIGGDSGISSRIFQLK